MRSRTGSALLVALLCALPASAQDEAEVAASVDAEEVAIDGTVTLQISVTTASKGEAPDLELPPLRDFDIVSRSQSEQVSFQFVGNQPTFRRTTVYSIALTPRRTGKAVIEAARVRYRGRRYQTQPIVVRVLPPGRGTPPPRRQQPDEPVPGSPFGSLFGDDDPFRGARPGARDLLLRASVDRERPYVGQQITYTLWLLSRVNVSGIDKLQLPRLDAFWTEEIEAPQQLVGESRVIDGVSYRAYMLRRRALFPLRAGKVAVDAAEVEVLTGFGMLFSRSSARRASQKLTIEVLPLPPGKPPGFDAGNVGQWELSASAEPTTAAVGQAITFRLQVSGKGNVRDVQAPRLPAVPGLRAYDATSTDKNQVDRGQVGGTRSVEQLLVPERSGQFVIPALAMETFDPVAGAYKTLRTQPFSITVRAGAAAVGAAGPSAASPQNLLSAGGMRPIRLKLTRVEAGAPPWTEPWFWPAMALGPFAALIAAGILRARRAIDRDAAGRRVRGAARAARRRLREAESLLRNGAKAPAFYAGIAHALTQYLADKQGVAASGLTREELAAALTARGHSLAVVQRLATALDECDRARFAPGASEPAAQKALLDRADRLLAELDRGRKEAA